MKQNIQLFYPIIIKLIGPHDGLKAHIFRSFKDFKFDTAIFFVIGFMAVEGPKFNFKY